MKSLYLYIIALLAFTVSYGWSQGNSKSVSNWPVEPWTSATHIELGRETPRTQTIPYNSEAAAIAQSREPSAYLQPLGDSWKISSSDNGQTALYEHTFKVPFSWIDRDLYLYVGSANAPYEIFVNGERVGYNQSASAPAEFNITRASKEDINNLEIRIHGDAVVSKLENRQAGFKPQLDGEAYIIAQPRVRVRDYVSLTHIEGTDAMIELGVLLKSNMLNPKTLTVHYSLLAPDGETVTSGRRDREIDMRREDTVRFIVNVPNVKLWSPEEPNLYTLIIKTQHEGRYWEYIAYKIGIRTAETKASQPQTEAGIQDAANKGALLVNGQAFPFRFAENFRLGNANKEDASANILDMKSRGINTIIANEPLPGWFYSLCDEKGIFIISQADINTASSGDSRKVGGNPANDTIWTASYIDRADAVIRTSRNHPSVIGFSLAAGTSNGYNPYESYLNAKNIMKEVGDGRPVIYKDAVGEWNTDAVMPQVVSTNPTALAGRVVLEELTPKSTTFAVKDAATGLFSISSSLYFRTINTKVAYTVRQGKAKVSRGIVDMKLRPDAEAIITVPYGKAKPGKGPLSVELSFGVPAGPGGVPAKTISETIEVPFS